MSRPLSARRSSRRSTGALPVPIQRARLRPYSVVLHDSLDEDEAGLCQLRLDVADREQAARQLLGVIGDRLDESLEHSCPRLTLTQVLTTIQRSAAAAPQWEFIGPNFDKPDPAVVALVPPSSATWQVARPIWVNFERLDRQPASRLTAVIEVHADSRTALLGGLLRGMVALFDPAMEVRKVALSPVEEARATSQFLGAVLARPTRPRRTGS